MNYRELCVDIFGTDQPECLIGIAEKAKKYDLLCGDGQISNPRNAGRKPKLREQEIAAIKSLHLQGISIEEIARRFRVTRPTIYRYMNM